MTRALAVWWEGTVVGSLTVDRHGAMRFVYDGDWLADPSAPALSVSLPKRPRPFLPRECRPFFEGLLPEGVQRDSVAAVLGVSRANEFKLLERLGGEVAGALALWPAGEVPPPAATEASATALSEGELASLLERLETRPFLAGEGKLRLSLAGAQSKLPVVLVEGRVALPAAGQPSTHILKPAIARFEATTENEAFAMRLGARIGLDVAPVEPYAAAADRPPCLVVARYDRRPGPDGAIRRLHQEDFCQALGIDSSRKYAVEGGPGFRQCFDLVRRACTRPAVEVLKLLDAAIFQVLIGNADAHGKNYSLLYRDGSIGLAPLYDLLCTVAYPDLSPKFAMRVAGRATLEALHPGDWDRFARSAGLGAPIVRRRVSELAGLALERADAVAEELALPGLSQEALAGFATRTRDRARRLALTVRFGGT